MSINVAQCLSRCLSIWLVKKWIVCLQFLRARHVWRMQLRCRSCEAQLLLESFVGMLINDCTWCTTPLMSFLLRLSWMATILQNCFFSAMLFLQGNKWEAVIWIWLVLKFAPLYNVSRTATYVDVGRTNFVFTNCIQSAVEICRRCEKKRLPHPTQQRIHACCSCLVV